MEKLTITRLGEEKTMSGVSKKTNKPYSFKKIGFQSQEYGDRWFDFTFNDTNPLKVGDSKEFVTGSRDYNGKTYWDASLPKQADVQFDKLNALVTSFGALKFKVESLERTIKFLVEGKKPPVSNYPTEDSEGMADFGESTPKELREVDPEDVPF